MFREIMEKRLEILESQPEIHKEAIDSGREALEMLSSENLKINEEKAITFITHLVMAVQRMECEADEPERLSPMIYEEIRSTDVFFQAVELLEKLCGKLERKFPESEREFLLVHLCNLLKL